MTSFAHDVPLTLGARIAAARRGRGLSQKQLASALRVSVWQIERIEAGEASPATHLTAIADVTGVQTAWLWEPIDARRESGTAALRSAQATVSALDVAGRLLVLGAITLLVTIRLFTEIVPIVPRAANFVDIPIFVMLGAAALFARAAHPVTPLATVATRCCVSLPRARCALGCSQLSSNRARSVLVFLYGFLAAARCVCGRLPPLAERQRSRSSRTIVALGLVEFAVVLLIDLPRFVGTNDPDQISGTFGTNAYQLVFFMLIFVTLVGDHRLDRARRLIAIRAA